MEHLKPGLAVAGVVCVLIALLAVMLPVSGGQKRGGHHQPAHVVRAGSTVGARPDRPAAPLPAGARTRVEEINRAQRIIDDPASSSSERSAAARLEQLATVALGRDTPRVRHATLALLRPQAAATMRTDLAAGAALSQITVPRKRFPPWRIAQPPSPGTLLGYFRQAQSKFGVGWQYPAAIEFIETRFGRIHGQSSAGARGPMQFLPTTWARYGSGSIDNQRNAIVAAARYLRASGARSDIATALYHYNNSTAYVHAVEDYAGRMRADARAYDGYYNWQVLFARAGRLFILPVGYPHVRPEPIHLPPG